MRNTPSPPPALGPLFFIAVYLLLGTALARRRQWASASVLTLGVFYIWLFLKASVANMAEWTDFGPDFNFDRLLVWAVYLVNAALGVYILTTLLHPRRSEIEWR